MRISIFLFIAILFIPFAHAEILSAKFERSTVIASTETQTLYIILDKPAISKPQDIQLKIFITGPATFDGTKKNMTLFMKNMSDTGMLSEIKKEIPIIIDKSHTAINDSIKISLNLSYYKKIFNYLNTNPTYETKTVTFKSIWTMIDTSKLENEISNTMEKYDKLYSEYNYTVKELNRVKNENLILSELNKKLTDENSVLSSKILKYNSFKILTLILLLSSLTLGSMLYIKKYRGKR